MIALLFAAAVFILLTCSCAGPAGTTAPAEVRPSQTTAPSAGPTSTVAATPVVAFEPVTARPTLAPTPTVWPMATLGAINTIPPNAPFTADDYFIIDKNWMSVRWTFATASDEGIRYGVIDANGNTVLPFAFSSIDKIVLQPKKGKTNDTILLFYAHEFSKINEEVVLDSGYLYNASGVRISHNRFDWVTEYQNDRLAARKTSTSLCGVMDSSLKTIIPFKYKNIVAFGTWMAAVKKQEIEYWIDFYDQNCKLVNHLQVGGDDISWMDCDLLQARGLNGKVGFIDKSMTWCAQPQWDTADVNSEMGAVYAGYLVSIVDGETLAVNKYGNAFVPNECDIFSSMLVDTLEDGHKLYQFSGDNGNFIFNDDGDILYHSIFSDYHFEYCDGVIIDCGKAYDLNGKDILPGIRDVVSWLPDMQLYGCGAYGSITAYYTKEGSKLPLPEAKNISCYEKDRFIIEFQSGDTGICNSEGQWLVLPRKQSFSWYQWPIIFKETDNDDIVSYLYGVVDDNGNMIHNLIFDELSVLSEKRGIYEVLYKGIHGIIDSKGNWIWHANEYSSLSD